MNFNALLAQEGSGLYDAKKPEKAEIQKLISTSSAWYKLLRQHFAPNPKQLPFLFRKGFRLDAVSPEQYDERLQRFEAAKEEQKLERVRKEGEQVGLLKEFKEAEDAYVEKTDVLKKQKDSQAKLAKAHEKLEEKRKANETVSAAAAVEQETAEGDVKEAKESYLEAKKSLMNFKLSMAPLYSTPSISIPPPGTSSQPRQGRVPSAPNSPVGSRSSSPVQHHRAQSEPLGFEKDTAEPLMMEPSQLTFGASGPPVLPSINEFPHLNLRDDILKVLGDSNVLLHYLEPEGASNLTGFLHELLSDGRTVTRILQKTMTYRGSGAGEGEEHSFPFITGPSISIQPQPQPQAQAQPQPRPRPQPQPRPQPSVQVTTTTITRHPPIASSSKAPSSNNNATPAPISTLGTRTPSPSGPTHSPSLSKTPRASERQKKRHAAADDDEYQESGVDGQSSASSSLHSQKRAKLSGRKVGKKYKSSRIIYSDEDEDEDGNEEMTPEQKDEEERERMFLKAVMEDRERKQMEEKRRKWREEMEKEKAFIDLTPLRRRPLATVTPRVRGASMPLAEMGGLRLASGGEGRRSEGPMPSPRIQVIESGDSVMEDSQTEERA